MFAKVLTQAVVAALLLVTASSNAQCQQFASVVPNGTCTVYPSTGLCAPYLAGQQVYLGFGLNTNILDAIAAKLIGVLETNRGIVDSECRSAGDALICNSIFQGCQLQGAEAIPVLACRSFCDAFWNKCQAAFDAFFVAAIQNLGQPKETFSFPHCGPTGTWTVEPQAADVFGNRSIPGLGPFPIGYNEQLRYPETSATFRRANNALLSVQCRNPSPSFLETPLDISPFVQPQNCPALLEEQSGECRIPCPFPVIPVDQQDSIGLAFVIPAIFALVFCIFVFSDSCFVIMESQGFNEILRRQKRFLLFKGSTTDTGDDSNGISSKSGARRRRNALRAATLYSLLGAVLGIIFFCIGPLMTLIRKSKISCGLSDDGVNLLQLVLGQADKTDSFCAAQRVAPFILQMVFNLILYAIVRVFMVVTERSRRMSKFQNWIFDLALFGYCAGIPILFLIIAASKDELSNNLIDFITQYVRNSAICVMRLSVTDEVILVFMPFILTGCAICLLSYYIYTHLSIINQNVQGIVSNGKEQKSSSATALRLLMVRLSFLGISTFVVLIVFISATGSLMSSMAAFAPRFNALFLCQATQATSCQSCEAEQALMLDKLPSAIPFAAQLASMSAITLLFGGFFAAQSGARLYKEYQDGSLKLKVLNMWRGKKESDEDGMETSFQSFSGDNKFAKLPEAMKESCATLFCQRMKRIRDSFKEGRARGQVFRWQKGKAPPKPRKTVFAGANAWTSSPRKPDEVSIKWQGVVGVPESNADPAQWSSSNYAFGGLDSSRPLTKTPGNSASPSRPATQSTYGSPINAQESSKGATWGNQAPSWGYSESKLSTSASSPSVFDTPGSSATRRDEFKAPPKLPEI